MDTFNTPAPRRTQDIRVLNGDQETFSFDTSLWREGSGWNAPSGSDLYVLMGGQITMKTWTHNFPIDPNCKFQGRDDAGACMLWAYGEDEIFRWFGAPSGAKGTQPVFTQYMTYASLTGILTPTGNGGRINGGAVLAGSIGEIITATAAPGAVSLTTNVSATITSIALTAGVWDVDGVVNYTPGATTSITQLAQGTNSVAATLGAQDSYSQQVTTGMVDGAIISTLVIPTVRVNISAGQTQYLVGRGVFTVSTLTAGGTIRATRVS